MPAAIFRGASGDLFCHDRLLFACGTVLVFFSSFSLVDLVCVVTDVKDAADARDFSRMNVNRKKDEKHAIGINISGRFFYSTTLRNTRS